MKDIIEIIEEKRNLANNTKDKEKREFLLLEIYAMIFGYISAQNDAYFYNYRTDLKAVELESKINKILNINLEIVGIKNTNLDSFLFYISNIEKVIDKSICNMLKANFYKGYNFYKDWYSNRTVIDDILGKEKKYTFKLRNLI